MEVEPLCRWSVRLPRSLPFTRATAMPSRVRMRSRSTSIIWTVQFGQVQGPLMARALSAVSGPWDAAFVFVAEVSLWDVLGDGHWPVVGLGSDGEVLTFSVSVAAHSH